MKKIFVFILILIVGVFCYYKFIYLNDIKVLLKEIEEEQFYIEEYSIFGTHLNISGCIDQTLDEELTLVLKNKKEEINVNSVFYSEEDKTCFYISDKNNDGIYLDELKIGNYLLLVKNSEDKYYSLKNNTEYSDLEYYTITKNNSNNKINIDFKKYKNVDYVEFKIKESKLPNDVYDITIDPGHGGNDIGASYGLNGVTRNESDITLEISLLLKQELEKLGLKVKLTREDDIFLDPYGEGGRAVIANDVKSKYSFSIHVNSYAGDMNYGGVEVYVPNDINYDLSKLLSLKLSNVVGYSKKVTDKIDDGVYYTYFTSSDIKESSMEMTDEGMDPYDIKVGAPYMYMIREVGGINTYAYIDGRNDEYGLNIYYNSNQTAEPYLIELGYINYTSDLKKLVNNPEKFSYAIYSAIKEYLNIS